MLYLTNPRGAKVATRKTTRRKSSKRRPTKKQLAARRKFAAMARARSKAAKRTKRASTKRKTTMAAKKRTRRKTTRKRTARRRSPVTRLRRGQVYVTNPRRRKGRRRYRRNPGARGILRDVQQLGMDSIGVLTGQAAGRFLSGFIPFGGSPVTELAKGAIIAIGIKTFGRRVLPGDFARMMAIGAFTAPLRDAIVSVAPQASGFLGAYPAPMALPSPMMGAFPGEIEDTGSSTMGSYAGGGEMFEM